MTTFEEIFGEEREDDVPPSASKKESLKNYREVPDGNLRVRLSPIQKMKTVAVVRRACIILQIRR